MRMQENCWWFFAGMTFFCIWVGGCSDNESSPDDENQSNDSSGVEAQGKNYSDLTWQDPPEVEEMPWEEAQSYCGDLTSEGHDDWVLPTISELRSLIRGCTGTMIDGGCDATEECLSIACWNEPCNGCDDLGGPGSGGAYWPEGMSGEVGTYWSSSPVTNEGASSSLPDVVQGWSVNFENAGMSVPVFEGLTNLVRCARWTTDEE